MSACLSRRKSQVRVPTFPPQFSGPSLARNRNFGPGINPVSASGRNRDHFLQADTGVIPPWKPDSFRLATIRPESGERTSTSPRVIHSCGRWPYLVKCGLLLAIGYSRLVEVTRAQCITKLIDPSETGPYS